MQRKRKKLATGSLTGIESFKNESTIEIIDVTLSPQIKKKVNDPKHNKLMQILKSYASTNSRTTRKNSQQTNSFNKSYSLGLDLTTESQQITPGALKTPNSASVMPWGDLVEKYSISN